ncbi:SGNH/GDSL hydrolase family protein [Kaistia dalseonensis]|uniref:SGNH hydrolase-type esterase domain-containing protein n=1 Tax=Kaistia dalseonensis TaxID=410840 RepID=A0ABU0H6H7_9HYPH|nr:SGNH/GDSL hydrolase family protein [Kaistia dalseonensis]MCX5495332.1 SGNH/GDSL hydrolase family protein [Kaistia dalseonensis]MDQ0437918.1 hypothetical protein [Kaistia dalseonensis]
MTWINRRAFLGLGSSLATGLWLVSHGANASEFRRRAMEGGGDGHVRMFAGSRAEFPFAFKSVAGGAAEWTVSRLAFANPGCEKTDLEAVFVNLALPPERGGAETPGPATIRVAAVLRIEGAAGRLGVAAHDRTAVVVSVAPGEVGRIIWPDTTIAAGARYYVDSFVQSDVEQGVPVAYQTNAERGEGVALLGTNIGDDIPIDAKVEFADGRSAFGPSALLARPVGQRRGISAALIVDSIGMGAAEARSGGDLNGQRGFLGRGLDKLGVDSGKLGMHGSVIASFLGDAFKVRRQIMNEAADLLVFQVGNNDLNRSLSDIIKDWSAMADNLSDGGRLPAIGVMPGPKTRSTDNWSSLAGQSVYPSDSFADPLTSAEIRFGFRHWMASQVGDRLLGVIDPLPYWSDAPQRPDYWKPGATADGTHPSAAAQQEAVKATIAPDIARILAADG